MVDRSHSLSISWIATSFFLHGEGWGWEKRNNISTRPVCYRHRAPSPSGEHTRATRNSSLRSNTKCPQEFGVCVESARSFAKNMTMDVNNRRTDVRGDIRAKTEDQTSTIRTKRSFDVAFLMLPDEKLKSKESARPHGLIEEKNVPVDDDNGKDDSDEEDIEVSNPDSPKSPTFAKASPPKYFAPKQQIFDDPSLNRTRIGSENELIQCRKVKISAEQKSAFTKVHLAPKECRVSPNLPASPDPSYQNSLSPSPPVQNRTYHHFPASIMSPNHIFKVQNTYANAFTHDNVPNFTAPHATHLDNPFLLKSPSPEQLQANLSKMRPVLPQYRPDLTYNYPQLQTQEMLRFSHDLKFASDMRNPTAAILTSLLPPSLAALSLPAQNVCAKCNISFRMTSDLVYHMRSHHKNDSVDYVRRKREDKLKCPVCAESFRERHHLTRHMTAHQDKDNEETEGETIKKHLPTYKK